MSALKTIVAGGVLFLLPFGLLVFLLGELVDLALLVASPLTDLLPGDDNAGKIMATFLAWALIMLACYIAGQLARMELLSNASSGLGEFLAKIIPGYRMLQTRTAEIFSMDTASPMAARSVLVTLGKTKRFGFEVSQDQATGISTVFLPNSPDPTTGIIVTANVADVVEIGESAGQLATALQFYGRGLSGPGDLKAQSATEESRKPPLR